MHVCASLWVVEQGHVLDVSRDLRGSLFGNVHLRLILGGKDLCSLAWHLGFCVFMRWAKLPGHGPQVSSSSRLVKPMPVSWSLGFSLLPCSGVPGILLFSPLQGCSLDPRPHHPSPGTHRGGPAGHPKGHGADSADLAAEILPAAFTP